MRTHTLLIAASLLLMPLAFHVQKNSNTLPSAIQVLDTEPVSSAQTRTSSRNPHRGSGRRDFVRHTSVLNIRG